MNIHTNFIPRPRRSLATHPDINILMMGETGVGKSTLINAFANYLIYNTLYEAGSGPMQILIPASFSMVDTDTFEEKKIRMGDFDANEQCEGVGQSATQLCRSYIFPIGNRLLRSIDAPGIGDVRGIDQDKENCDHILNYISHYEYLNGICILFKPNHERLTVAFRFCFKEILTHLHINAKDNLMFIFTNGRSTFYRPGSTAALLRNLLAELKETWEVNVPFDANNTFIFDNEAFRFLALYKNGMKFSTEETAQYNKSWMQSVDELTRLIARILRCDTHAVRDSISINAAQQLIRKLTRPIGEIARLIQENIELAKNHKQHVLHTSSLYQPRKIPQKVGKIIYFDFPRTVCTNRKCIQVISVDNERTVDYRTHCHPHCYLRDVERECVGHSVLRYCDAINKQTGRCQQSGCHWKEHMHITYEYQTSIIYVEVDPLNNSSPLSAIDKRSADLRHKESEILSTCKQLSKFIKQYPLTPYNDDIIEYIRYFIREEELKKNAGANNAKIIEGLQNLIQEYENEQKLYENMEMNQTNSSSGRNQFQPEDILGLVRRLYKLPINGPSIRQQIEGLEEKQLQVIDKKDIFVRLPFNANSSTVMKQLKEIIN